MVRAIHSFALGMLEKKRWPAVVAQSLYIPVNCFVALRPRGGFMSHNARYEAELLSCVPVVSSWVLGVAAPFLLACMHCD